MSEDKARAEAARWQALATRAVEALRGLRKVPLPVEHAEAVSEALRSFDAAGTTTALDQAIFDAQYETLTKVLAGIRFGVDTSSVLVEALKERDQRIAQEANATALAEAVALFDSDEDSNLSMTDRIRALAKKAAPKSTCARCGGDGRGVLLSPSVWTPCPDCSKGAP